MVANRYFVQRLILSVLVLSGISSKLLRLYQHYQSMPFSLFVIYFPTFFVPEIFLFIAVWALLYNASGRFAVATAIGAGFLACVELVATSSQFSFYYVTGGEIRWGAAKSIGTSRRGMRLLLSGLVPTVASATVIGIASCIAAPGIWHWMTRWLHSLSNSLRPKSLTSKAPPRDTLEDFVSHKPRFYTFSAGLLITGLWVIRPAVPYDHMTEALPFALLGDLSSHSKTLKATSDRFPLPELLSERFWESPHGSYKGWKPTLGHAGDTGYANQKPDWAAGSLPPGFERWSLGSDADAGNLQDDKASSSNGNRPADPPRVYYDPAQDPMRITNLDSDLLESLKEALQERDIPINHIVMVFLESTRKDVFPLKSNSRLHSQMRATQNFEEDGSEAEFNKTLASLTPIAESLTGEHSGFNVTHANASNISTGPDRGGISFDGVLTGSTLSAKSRLVNYCGVQALPVDFMAENDLVPYQPCLMQILELMNQRKNVTADSDFPDDDPLEQKWQTIFAQSATGGFQDQKKHIRQMGFHQTLFAEDINKKRSKYWHHQMERINYFGYPETEVRPYIRDMINDTLNANKRLFLSHFTSTTHHPWNTPADFSRKDYFGPHSSLSQHNTMNDYLNTIRFDDEWLGDLMGLIENAGIANQTLTVFVGDHGTAFKEDCPMTETYQNPHISTFRVPLLFHHPLLPRMHLTANTTTISILPTILDLLIATGSLNERDSKIALDLVNEYEGQSLIRPFRASHNGREAWNMGVINAGGTLLSVGSAAVPYRLGLPLSDDLEYRFTNTENDPHELSPVLGWSIESLVVEAHLRDGAEAANWLRRADKVGRWWIKERKILWNY
ncbi:hypothetical protein NUU61_003937 [Penicillium alfredii]|uniref:Sulfatase N-terminal domain-containing protein n=1 Tax=Penicillium alfredii TaxID=1506179 RepID=A0A9W9KCT8_9EURO|nr:uncharacterized protein NUU61_003937 [Penicillium alfredii]KAJ5101715.1 hypothetical protein NUU61_003937 [Penicillium alfredii]